ncbi:MAG: DUF420 domain-containing protein [Candidatus Zixiibacteriota bacterium]|nr:MAG: DUF420 domain-containing protein [candidate division Zixibacteria bacterium]
MSTGDLPTLNAALNLISVGLLTVGYIHIKKNRPGLHKRFMLSALGTSALFLISYLVYHNSVGSVPYPYHDWTRPVYFAILVPHVILAAVMVPFIIVMVWRALRGDFVRHRRLARRVWPVWMFVSVSGVLVYLMLYQL